jgi:hypothetical protein
VIDAAYDALPPTDFCAETLAQPPIGPLAADLNRPADYFRPSLRCLSVNGTAMNFRLIASGIMMSRPRATCLLYLPTYLLKRHAVGCEQQHFAIAQHARKPCADSVRIKLDVNVSGCVPIIRLSHW